MSSFVLNNGACRCWLGCRCTAAGKTKSWGRFNLRDRKHFFKSSGGSWLLVPAIVPLILNIHIWVGGLVTSPAAEIWVLPWSCHKDKHVSFHDQQPCQLRGPEVTLDPKAWKLTKQMRYKTTNCHGKRPQPAKYSYYCQIGSPCLMVQACAG